MTTKNQEFTFDLQNFATSTQTLPATVLSGAYNGFDGSGTPLAVIAATNSSINVNPYANDILGGWMVTDNLTNGIATIDTSGTSVETLSVAYDHAATFTYYAFDGSNNSYTIANGTATDSTAAAASNTYVGLASASVPAGISFENTLKAATTATPATITGGGTSGGVSLSGIGSIATFGNDQSVALAASGGKVSLTGVNGAVELTADSTAFKQSINGALVNAVLDSGKFISINGGENWGSPTLSAGAYNVTIGSIDTVQTWNVNASQSITNTINGIGLTAGSELLTVKGASGNFDVNLAAGDTLSVSDGTKTSAKNDVLVVNGTTLAGAAQGDAAISVDDASIMSVTYNTANNLGVGENGAGGSISGVDANGNVTIEAGIITAVDDLTSGGTWTLGANDGQLGSDMVSFATVGGVITADSAGTGIAGLGNSIGAAVSLTGDHEALTVNGGKWAITATGSTDQILGLFDADGNATITSGASIIGGNAKSLAIGTHDTMSLAAASQITLDSNGYVSTVNSLAAGSTWLVKDGESRIVAVDGVETLSFANPASSGVFAELTMDSAKGASVSAIDSLSGNVTVGASSISGLEVAGTTWTISGTSDSVASFDSTGKLAAVTANSTVLAVTADATDASVSVSLTGADTVTGAFNGATVHVHDGDSIVGVQLESGGISGITSLNSGATITGDNEFNVNENFYVRNGATSNTQFTLGGASSITVQNVVDGDAYTVTGSTGNAIVYSMDSLAAGATKVSVNSAKVTISVAEADTDGAYIRGVSGDDIAIVGGVKLNDVVKTTGDQKFSVVYDTSNVSSSSTDTYVMEVNDAKVSLKAANIATVGSAITMAADNSGTTPHVTISTGIANSATVTVGKGVYNVGNSAAVTVNDSIGYLYVDSDGNVTAEDSIVAYYRQQRDASLSSFTSSLHSSVSTSQSIGAFHDFYNIYYGNNTVFGETDNEHNATVASYENATVTTRYSTISPSGVNIYGDKNLSQYPNSVTLQSYLSAPIDIEHIEGKVDGETLSNAVIDVRNGNNSVVAVGTDSSYDSFATNHTILGSAKNSTLIIGTQATGDNYVQGGTGNDSIIHQGNGKATLLGGDGNDTIAAMAGDSVEGGSGVDYFFDSSVASVSSGYEISDYNFNEGDVIIATKLSTLTRANVSVEGNRIAVSGGPTLTVGSAVNYDESTATKAIIANANGSARTNVMWAGIYDSEVNAGSLEGKSGAFMIADHNGSGADTVIGSANVDTIYVGGNDSVYSGAGKDTINIESVSADSGRRGATVFLAPDMNVVNGWTGGFDNDSGSNVIAFTDTTSTAANLNFKTSSSGAVVAYSDGASLGFNDLSATNGGYNFLVGQDRVTFVESNHTVTVSSDDDLASYYKGGGKSGIYVGESVTSSFGVDLTSSNFVNITALNLQNKGKVSVIGSSANETVTLVGSADAGASKSVAAGAGNDVIYSGGASTTNAGNYLFFGTYDGFNLGSGKDTIYNFSFYQGDVDDSYADVLYIGDDSFDATVRSGKLDIALNDNDKITIIDSTFDSTYDSKIVKIRSGVSEPVLNYKFGLSTGANQFTYDGKTNVYYGNASRGQDTLNVSSSSDLYNVGIWLGNKEQDANEYIGINNVSAANVTGTNVSLAGNSNSNLIQAGGADSHNSLWGGGGMSNTLVGGAGEDTFFYFKGTGYTDDDGNAHSSNDVIQNVQSNDLIWMYDVALSDLSYADIQSNQITIGLNNGSTVAVSGISTDTQFRISDGQGGWQTYTAVNSGNEHYWA